MLLSACGGGSKTSSAFEGEILPLKYAENLTLIQGEGYTEARLRNPEYQKQICCVIGSATAQFLTK